MRASFFYPHLYAVVTSQHIKELSQTQTGVFEVEFIQRFFYRCFIGFCAGLVVCPATMYAQQLTLPFAGNLAAFFIQELASLLYRPSSLDFFVSHSNSISRLHNRLLSRSFCSSKSFSRLLLRLKI